jgi:hypothetical protein
MILTLHSLDNTVQIDITADQFTRLRDPKISREEINSMALDCGINLTLLIEYVEDLKKTAQEVIELDGSCDYSDHL